MIFVQAWLCSSGFVFFGSDLVNRHHLRRRRLSVGSFHNSFCFLPVWSHSFLVIRCGLLVLKTRCGFRNCRRCLSRWSFSSLIAFWRRRFCFICSPARLLPPWLMLYRDCCGRAQTVFSGSISI
jgi:hypothetical protein